MADIPKTEFLDTAEEIRTKLVTLSGLLAASTYTVVYTGAGISTAASIPDYSGDEGLKKKPKPLVVLGLQEQELDYKMPTYSHVILANLVKSGHVKFIVTSNHDNLHQKSGVGMENMCDLFGNVFVEKCGRCNQLWRRQVITPSLGRNCDTPGCGGRLFKTGTRMNAETPKEPLERGWAESKRADLALVLGSSMQIGPFCDMPPLAKKMVLVTLQETPYDKDAELVIHAPCDVVLKHIASGIQGIDTDHFEFELPFQLVLYRKDAPSDRLTVQILGASPNEPPKAVESAAVSLVGQNVPLVESSGRWECEIAIPRNAQDDGSTDLTVVVQFREDFQVPAQKYTLPVSGKTISTSLEGEGTFRPHRLTMKKKITF